VSRPGKQRSRNAQPAKERVLLSLQVRSLQVTIEAAHKLVSRTTCRPYCTLSLNAVHVARTKVKEGLKPVWGEDFLFE